MNDTIKVYSLSTKDNPFNPLTDFDNWFDFDIDKGYNTSGKLARIVGDVEGLSEPEAQLIISNAIDRFLEVDFTGLYKKVEGSIPM